MGFPRINSFFRGILRLCLAAAFGALIALPVRYFLSPSVEASKAAQSSSETAKNEEKEAAARAASEHVPGDGRTASATAPEKPYPVGYVVRGSRVTVAMSDGTTRIERYSYKGPNAGEVINAGEVTDVQRNSVTIDGEKLFIRASMPPTAADTSMVAQGTVTGQQSPPAAVAAPVADPSGWVLGADGVWRSPNPTHGIGR